MTTHADARRTRPSSGVVAARGGDDRRPAGAQPRHDRRLAGPRRPGLGPAGGAAGARGHGRRAQGPDGEREIAGRRPVPGLPDDGAGAATRSSPRSACPRSTATATATRSSPAAPRTGRWSACARWSSRPTDGSCEDVRIGLTQHGLDAAARDRGRGGAARAGRSTPDAIAAAAEQAAEGTEPPGDLNATPDYKRHLARVLHAARAGGGGRGWRDASTASGEDVERGPRRRGLPGRPGAGHRRLPGRHLEQPLLLEGEAGRGQDRGRQGARRRDRRAADPAAVPRGHRRPPRALRLGLPAPAARACARPRRGADGARAVLARVPAAPAAARGARARRAASCC